MIAEAKYKVRRAARNTAFGAAGVLLLTVGIGFLTAAAWIGLSLVADALTAALVLGGAYTGVGLILLGIAASRGSHDHHHDRHPAHQPTGPEVFTGMGVAFMQGLDAGRATRNGFERGRNH